MKYSRRTLLSGAGAMCVFAHASSRAAFADDTAEYFYDPLGRLIRVELSDGTIIVYDYDAAGNRTRVVHGDDVPFNQTLQITGTGPVNLRTVADQAGYIGLTDANITFQVGSAVTIMGAPIIGRGIDTGLWPSGTYSIALTLEVSGKVYGGGGQGGGGSSGGGVGGDAIYCQENLAVTVNASGQVKAGGGGGAGGGSWQFDAASDPPVTTYYYGGGGGGGFPNGLGGAGGPGGAGASGTTSGGGAGGSGATIMGGRTVGAGGAGAGAAGTGSAGTAATGTQGCSAHICRYIVSPGAGGPPGYAVRKNGKTVSVTNNGTVTGTVG